MVGMRTSPALAICGALLLLTACAAEPAVDLDEARTWLDTVEAEQSDGPGAAGVASMLVGTETQDPDDGVQLDFSNPTTLKRADARCFGDGTVDVTVMLRAADGASTKAISQQIACDEEVHGIDLSEQTPAASTAFVSGRGSAETYLHVVLIEELVVER